MSLDDFDKIVSSGSINFCAPLSFQSKLSLFASLENNELLRLFQLSQNANMKIAPSHAPQHSTHKIIRDLTLQKVFSFRFCSMKSHICTFFFKFIDFFQKRKVRKELSPHWLMLVQDDEFFPSRSFFTWLSFHRVHSLKTILNYLKTVSMSEKVAEHNNSKIQVF